MWREGEVSDRDHLPSARATQGKQAKLMNSSLIPQHSSMMSHNWLWVAQVHVVLFEMEDNDRATKRKPTWEPLSNLWKIMGGPVEHCFHCTLAGAWQMNPNKPWLRLWRQQTVYSLLNDKLQNLPWKIYGERLVLQNSSVTPSNGNWHMARRPSRGERYGVQGSKGWLSLLTIPCLMGLRNDPPAPQTHMISGSKSVQKTQAFHGMEVALHYSDIFFELRNPKAICFGISEVVVFFFSPVT